MKDNKINNTHIKCMLFLKLDNLSSLTTFSTKDLGQVGIKKKK